jgi:ADP-heptose:LPS heptosyltransferase
MKKILVLLPNNMGDVIMTLPVLEALKSKFNDHQISFFVEKGFEGGLINYKFCDNIILFERKKIRDLIRSDLWESGIELLKEIVQVLNEENFEQVINLSQNRYVSHFVSNLKGKRLFGQNFIPQGNHCIRDRWSEYLYAIPFGRYYNSFHVTDIYKRIADVPNISFNSGITIKNEEKEQIGRYIESQRKNSDSPIAIFQPGAAYDSKRWPVEHFISLGRRVIEDGYTIFVTGDIAERDLAERLKNELGENCVASSGELSFRESIALISFSEFCVTSDTSVMHAAASLSKKVYALFGPTNPVETGPYAPGNLVFSGRCNKRPCFCIECKSKLCMKSISPQTVFSYIKKKPEANPSCDIYQTTFKDGIYCLLKIVEKGQPYYSKTGAMITRKSLEADTAVDTLTGEYRELYESSICFIRSISKMREHLYSYIASNSNTEIQKFESVKESINGLGGINDFWNAILNIRLNSVPLLDPVFAVKESIIACDKTIAQIETALSK